MEIAKLTFGGNLKHICRALVWRKVRSVLPGIRCEDAIRALDEYCGPERERVQLATLKLSEGRLDRLRHYVEAAIQDYRDVLAWAEYPREISIAASESLKMGTEEIAALRDQDRREYLAWLQDDQDPA
jgi:hypothetical protein